MPLSTSASFRTANAWVAAAAASLLFAIALMTAPIATADPCDNAALRAQNNSTALPDCRAYEMVSPPYKEGFAIETSLFAGFTDEGIVSYQSFGSFAGNAQGNVPASYHATRSTGGWMTTALAPPDLLYDPRGEAVVAESVDLRQSLWIMSRRDLPGDEPDFYLRDSAGAFTRIADAEDEAFGRRFVAGESADLSHILFNHGNQGPGRTDLYEQVGADDDGPPRAVSIDNHGQPTPPLTCLDDLSPDGRVIVYTAGCDSSGLQVWARVAGSATVAVSGSECTRSPDDPGGVCNEVSAARYEGAADDGSRVFFTTSQQLVNGDTDQTKDLYACDIPAGVPVPVGVANPCATLTQVSGIASDARVGSVPVVSEDGSRVYFVAEGAALADNLGVNGAAPVVDQANLYVWTKDAAHPAGEVKFVAKLDADDVGELDARAQITPDARYFVFRTASALVTSGPGADGDGGARDVYRYDVSTHTMVRLSTSVTGSGGNGSGFDVSLSRRSSMTPDGSTVIFDTAEALSPSDTNGVTDVYSWRNGQVSLISADGGNAMGISESGRDIFFLTDAQVVAADGDVVGDVYTARIGGGFDLSRPVPCSGDGCQGPSSGAPGLAAPRSGLSGDSDSGDSDSASGAGAVFSLRSVSAAQRRRLAATGKVTVMVRSSLAGTVRATARAKIAGRLVTVGSGRRTMARPGSAAVTLKLSRKARAQLARRGRLTVRVSVGHSRASRGRSVTLKLTLPRASKSSVGGRS